MPSYYGGRGRRDPRRIVWIGAAIGLTIAAAVLALAIRYLRNAGSSQAEDWAIMGPPCPAISASDYRQRYAARERTAEFDGDLYARQVGHMSCRSVPDPGGLGFTSHPVCQFTGPVALRVHTANGEVYFEPGIGRRATVSRAHGRTACVVGGNFTGNFDPT
jgi:hypothetical protein